MTIERLPYIQGYRMPDQGTGSPGSGQFQNRNREIEDRPKPGDLFTDRKEAIALFDQIRGPIQVQVSKSPASRDPHDTSSAYDPYDLHNTQLRWPPQPILTFIGPGGSGKSKLINHLKEHCCVDGQPAIPYASLDFTLPEARKDPLSIMVNLRDQLQGINDRQGKHLEFPRFDLLALVAKAAQTQEAPDSLMLQKLEDGKLYLQSLSALGSSLGVAVPYIAPLLGVLDSVERLPIVREILLSWEKRGGWTWYKKNYPDITHVSAGDKSLRDVLKKLKRVSILDTPEREKVINKVLPEAFHADLLDALGCTHPPHAPHAWTDRANVVLFLDGFEKLSGSSRAGKQDMDNPANILLEALALPDHRKRGETDPLLLVVGTRDRFLREFTNADQEPPFELRTEAQEERVVKERVRNKYEQWKNNLPKPKDMQLKNFILPEELRYFGEKDIRRYLENIDRREDTQVFADTTLVKAIDHATGGHPLFLALAAEAAIMAKKYKPDKLLTAEDFGQEKVSPKLVPGHQNEQIAEYLLNLFLRQLPPDEQRKLNSCAVPRSFDIKILRSFFGLNDPADQIKAKELWEDYSKLTFLRAIDDKRLVFHPVVRELMLKKFPPSDDPEDAYYILHNKMREYYQEYYHKLVDKKTNSIPPEKASEAWLARIEEAYHALALGNAQPAIEYGKLAQTSNLDQWNPLLEAVSQAPQAPMELMREEDTRKQADEAWDKDRSVDFGVQAIILYKWLLTTAQNDPRKSSRLQYNLGNAFENLPTGNRTANLKKAIEYFDAALQVYTPENFPFEWAATLNDLGVAYSKMPTGDRADNLLKSIACHLAALEVFTPEKFPAQWAGSWSNLGNTIQEFPTGDRNSNLNIAIKCYEAALHVYTHKEFPVEWATAQNNLGNTYQELPTGDLTANLKKAIECFDAALEVYTNDEFPSDWAMTQMNQGNAYARLSTGDRAANLQQAINHYNEALKVYTRETSPVEWARTQNNMGRAHQELPTGDYADNLEKAITYYKEALQVRTRDAFPADYATTQNNLAMAYYAQGKYDQAEPLLQEAIEIRKNVLGKEHPDYATGLHSLAGLYRAQGKYDQAEPLLQEAVKIDETVLGKDHPTTRTLQENLRDLRKEMQK